MTNILLFLLDVHIDKAAHLARMSVRLRGTIPLVWVCALWILLAMSVVWMYRRTGDHVAPWKKFLLTLLRTFFLGAILALLLHPVIRFTVEGSVRRSLLMLVDDSDSINLQDNRTDPADITRAAIAMGAVDPTKGVNQPVDAAVNTSLNLNHIARLELIKGVMKNQRLNLIDRLSSEYDIRPYIFGRALQPVALPSATQTKPDENADTEVAIAARKAAVATWINGLKAPEQATAVGDAIRDALAQTRGQPLAGVWIITDGQSNAGSSVALAADRAKQAGVPVYAYGVGITTPKDIIVDKILAPDVCFVDDDLPISVSVRNTGMAGVATHLDMKLGNEPIDGADVVLDPTGTQFVPVKFKPTKPGEYDLTARIEPRPEEADKDNNQATHHIKVIDGKIKILYVEQSPRWEFKYLFAMLLRDRRVNLKCVLLEGDPGISVGDKTPFLKEFPTNKEDLYKYDLLILGDVDPKTFSPEQMTNIQEFVAKFGGGMLAIAGRRFMPWGYAGTPIDDLLPVNVEEERSIKTGRPFEPAPEANDQPIHLELTPDGAESPMLKLSDKPEENESIWHKLPPVFWDARVARAKKLATVLLVDPNPAKESRDGERMPVIALHAPGIGQVMFVGTDNIWRWRKNVGDRYYVAIWGQIVQRLALPHLLGESKKTQLASDKLAYNTGDPVTVFARLYDQAFKPIDQPEVRGYAQNGDQTPVPIPLRPVAGGQGVYRAAFPAGLPGNWSFYVESDPATKINFSVTQPQLERSESALNEKDLRDLCAATGGQFFREEDLNGLPDSIRLKNERVQSTFEAELCFTWIYFILLITLVTAEWILRKLCQLK